MTGLILAIALAAQPNIFEPSEMSSDAIVQGVEACFVTMQTQLPPPMARAYCGCAMDAVRANARRGRKPTDATPEQEKRCLNAATAPRAQPEKGKGKAGT